MVSVCSCVLTRSAVSSSFWPQGLYSLPGSSVHGIFQARILEWVAIPFSRGSSWPRDQTWVSCIAGGFFTVWASRETQWSLETTILGGFKKKLSNLSNQVITTNFWRVYSVQEPLNITWRRALCLWLKRLNWWKSKQHDSMNST